MEKKKLFKNKQDLLIVILIVIVSLGIVSFIIHGIVTEDSSEENKEPRNYEISPEINNYQSDIMCDAKPIIYLYPEKEMEVTVKLGNHDKLTCTYPKYGENGWTVIAKPDGKLIDTETGRNLYSLYWEGLHTEECTLNEGFVVKGKDSIKFLEEKLEILGLNEYEAEEFIVYWLPKLEVNKYNFIRFASMEEINKNMPLEVSGNPDSVIRVLIQFKGLDKPIEVKEQKLTTPERIGFTVVEWGGTEIK